MARKVRLEFPGAIYHVFNRGNYRTFAFESLGARQAFEGCLFQACARYGWILHAFVIMGNHFHLAVATPRGNMVAGMHWLQSTFANRFNRMRDERGHLFQGRYHALLVEEGDALGNLCHYLHLNPAKAGLVPVAKLEGHRHSSYWYLQRPRRRPAFLRVETALALAGGLADTADGRRSYGQYLAWRMAKDPVGSSATFEAMCRGWALGGDGFKQQLLAGHSLSEEIRAWADGGAQEIREQRWHRRLTELLREIAPGEKADQRSSAPWKVRVATAMKDSTDAPNHWLAEHLKMGSPRYLAKLVSLNRPR